MLLAIRKVRGNNRFESWLSTANFQRRRTKWLRRKLLRRRLPRRRPPRRRSKSSSEFFAEAPGKPGAFFLPSTEGRPQYQRRDAADLVRPLCHQLGRGRIGIGLYQLADDVVAGSHVDLAVAHDGHRHAGARLDVHDRVGVHRVPVGVLDREWDLDAGDVLVVAVVDRLDERAVERGGQGLAPLAAAATRVLAQRVAN